MVERVGNTEESGADDVVDDEEVPENDVHCPRPLGCRGDAELLEERPFRHGSQGTK